MIGSGSDQAGPQLLFENPKSSDLDLHFQRPVRLRRDLIPESQHDGHRELQALASAGVGATQKDAVQVSEAAVRNEKALPHCLKVVVMRQQNVACLDAVRRNDRVFRVLDENVLQKRNSETLSPQVIGYLPRYVVIEEKRRRGQP